MTVSVKFSQSINVEMEQGGMVENIEMKTKYNKKSSTTKKEDISSNTATHTTTNTAGGTALKNSKEKQHSQVYKTI